MFYECSEQIADNPPQLHYGVAVTDADGDGAFEFVVAGYGCGNLVLKWDGRQYVNRAEENFADARRQAIGIAAGDLDGDGREEIYVLNTDSFAGRKQHADRLWKWQANGWQDLFTLPANRDAHNLTAGRSVVCLDRQGTGRYSFFVANYGGPMRCYELEENGFLSDLAPYLGLAYITGGRSALALPLVSEHVDIFAGNEGGPNFLFRNRGDGTFEEIAERCGLEDPFEHARGVAVLDANQDGRFDLVVGNWEGMHRLYAQTPTGTFVDATPDELAQPSRVRTIIAADFDNDGYEELFFNNIGEPNRLFGVRNGVWTRLPMGDALEPRGLGTGAAVGDMDGDGRLELLIAHGESALQPLSLYKTQPNGNHWLRVLPLTKWGAPARNAVVTLTTSDRTQIRAIDGGSGYLCQMEPVAHFGLGTQTDITRVTVRWPDGVTQTLQRPNVDSLLRVPYPG